MVILVDGPERAEAESLAKRFNLSIVTSAPKGNYLVCVDGKWRVQAEGFSIGVDFDEAFKRLSHQKLSAKKDLLARAVGLDKKGEVRVLDATLGLGKDAFHLAYLGAEVKGVEKDLVPYILVESALADSALNRIKGSLTCHFGKSEEFVKEAGSQFDVLYFDPMFEDIEKKSLPKKEMQFLRSRQIENNDETEVIDWAFRSGIERVVVKRPVKGSELYPEPKMTLFGKMIRYDIYQLRSKI